MGWNPLKGALGDALHAALFGAGHNIRLLMKKLRLLWPEMMDWLRVPNGPEIWVVHEGYQPDSRLFSTH